MTSFEKMNLLPALFKGIKKKGYKLPTPIQRKSIAPALSGHDLIAVGRTGSGKTAAFLIPVINRLGEHSDTVGARALILSPSRQLALQTLKFAHDLGKYTSLKFCALVGGDGLKHQFTKLAENPDIIIATPGRLLHFIVQLNYSLSLVQIVVLDQSDRLIQFGLMEQVKSILGAASRQNKQTLCFSATLPDVLTEFTRTGLTNPLLIKLDQEYSLPEQLSLDFFIVREQERLAALVFILRMIKPHKLTMVFVATKYHVEFLEFYLESLGFSCIGIHGGMDQQARRKALQIFHKKKKQILVATDLTARGLDIPLLDCMVHYDFPASAKLFLHRSGRVARAGRPGSAYAIVGVSELPYLIDVQTHLGLTDWKRIGSIESGVLRSYIQELRLHLEMIDIDQYKAKQNTVKNALKAYMRTRPGASAESAKRAKNFQYEVHPMFQVNSEEFYQRIKQYKPQSSVIQYNQKLNTNLPKSLKPTQQEVIPDLETHIKKSFAQVQSSSRKRGKRLDFKSKDFISYSGNKEFEKDSDFSQVCMQLPVDDDPVLQKRKTVKWDKKKKKYVEAHQKKLFLVNDKAKKLYKEWSKQSKKRIQTVGEKEDPENMRKSVGTSRKPQELRSKQQIMKERRIKAKKEAKLKKHKKVKQNLKRRKR